MYYTARLMTLITGIFFCVFTTNGAKYRLAKSTDDLVAGKNCVIVYNPADGTTQSVMSINFTSNNTFTAYTVIMKDEIVENDEETLLLTIGGTAPDKFTLYASNTYKTKDRGYINLNKEKTLSIGSSADDLTIEIDKNGYARIRSTINTYEPGLRKENFVLGYHDYNSGYFGCYDDGTNRDYSRYIQIYVESSQEESSLSWSDEEEVTTLGEDIQFPTLSVTPADAAQAVTYSSSDDEVASVAADGVVTIVGAGTCDIIAEIPNGNEYFTPCKATYTLVVIDPDVTSALFDFSKVQMPADGLSATNDLKLRDGAVTMTLSGNITSGNDGILVGDDGHIAITVPEDYEITGIHITPRADGLITAEEAGIFSNTETATQWSPTHDQYYSQIILLQNAEQASTINKANVDFRLIPEATEPDVTVIDGRTLTFTALHPSHTVMYRTCSPADAQNSARMRAPITDTGWTESPDHNKYTHQKIDTEEPYLLSVKTVDLKGRESEPLTVLVRAEDVFTGISDITTDSLPTQYYDLYGRHIAVPPAHGLYISRSSAGTKFHLAR